MNYRQIFPEKSLRQYVRHFAILESDHASTDSRAFKILADGCPGLIFQENTRSFSDHNKQHFPQLFLHGLTTRHTGKSATGHFNNIGVYFQPDGLKSIFGIDACELTDTYVDLSLLRKCDLPDRLPAVSLPIKRIEIIAAFIRRRLHQNKRQTIMPVLDLLKRDKGKSSLTKLQTELKLSERSVERLFCQYVGISPKLFTRILRFQSALQMMRTRNFAGLFDIAHSNGYADQSHFIREFKEFSGSAPKQFLRHAHEQVENFPEWLA